MSESFLVLHDLLTHVSEQVLETLAQAQCTPPEGSNISVKALLEPLLSRKQSAPISEDQIWVSIKDFTLACALLSSSRSSSHDLLAWISTDLSTVAESAYETFSKAYVNTALGLRNSTKIGDLGLKCSLVPEEKRLLLELMPEVLPLLRDRIRESSIDKSDKVDEISAASARSPVGFAIVSAYQFRWFANQMDYPHLAKLCPFLIPCALTCLDHWSPEVKGQGMIGFVHLAKNVKSGDLGGYEDVILDACCQNIASSDDIWCHLVEMSVSLSTCILQSNPRSPWFERMLNEMLSHLERQPRNIERRVVWLRNIEPLLNCVGLVLLAHTRRIFPLFFKWMNADDDETVLLVLQRVQPVLRLTWIRNTPFVERLTEFLTFSLLVDMLCGLYKKAETRSSSEEIKKLVLQTLEILQQSRGLQFETTWSKHKDDTNLVALAAALRGNSGEINGEHSVECGDKNDLPMLLSTQ